MTLTPLDSQLWVGLFGSPVAQAHLADEALIAAMIQVEIALGHALEACEITAPGTGKAIETALADVKPEISELAETAASDGVPIPALLSVLRTSLSGEALDALHWGATSQDIVDTAMVLCLRDFKRALLDQADDLIDRIALLAGQEAETLQLARTRTQGAVPTTFGSTLSVWGAGLMEAAEAVSSSVDELAVVSLYGAAGNDSVLAGDAPDVRLAMAEALKIGVDQAPWHTRRARISAFAGAMTALATQAGRIASDLAFLASTGINEVSFAGGRSSAMPYKVNPVRAEAAQSLARFSVHLQGAVAESAIHGSQRDGVAWSLEWLALRPLCGTAAAALDNIDKIIETLQINRDAMAKNLKSVGPAALSEMLTYRLSQGMPRSDARKAVAAALGSDNPLETLKTNHPGTDWTGVEDWISATGRAPHIARAFASSRGHER